MRAPRSVHFFLCLGRQDIRLIGSSIGGSTKKSVITVLAVILVVIVTLSRNLSGEETLGSAFESGDTAKILQLFIDNPQLLKTDMGGGMTPLHFAVYFGYVPVVDYALTNGIDMNIKDRRGLTPVWFSISSSRPNMLRKFIALGADLSVKNPQGDDMLFRAASAVRFADEDNFEVAPMVAVAEFYGRNELLFAPNRGERNRIQGVKK